MIKKLSHVNPSMVASLRTSKPSFSV